MFKSSFGSLTEKSPWSLKQQMTIDWALDLVLRVVGLWNVHKTWWHHQFSWPMVPLVSGRWKRGILLCHAFLTNWIHARNPSCWGWKAMLEGVGSQSSYSAQLHFRKFLICVASPSTKQCLNYFTKISNSRHHQCGGISWDTKNSLLAKVT